MSREFLDCGFSRSEITDFQGCPGLDYYGDDDECGDCPYRLDRVIKALSYICFMNSSGHDVDAYYEMEAASLTEE